MPDPNHTWPHEWIHSSERIESASISLLKSRKIYNLYGASSLCLCDIVTEYKSTNW